MIFGAINVRRRKEKRQSISGSRKPKEASVAGIQWARGRALRNKVGYR